MSLIEIYLILWNMKGMMIGILPCLCRPFHPTFTMKFAMLHVDYFKYFVKLQKVFQMAPDDFARNMDMPDNLIPYLHKSNALGLPTWLSRFDFVLDVNGNLRMVELNADTPCFLIESYYANEVAANYVGRKTS